MAKAHALNSAEATFSQNAQAGSGRSHKWPKLARCKSNNCPTSLRGISQRPHLANMCAWDLVETTFGQILLAGSGRSHAWPKHTSGIRQKPYSAHMRMPDPMETTFGQHAGSGRSHVWPKCRPGIRQKLHSANKRFQDLAEAMYGQSARARSGRNHIRP